MTEEIMILFNGENGHFGDSVFAEQLSENRFRLTETPLLFPKVTYGCEVEAYEDENGDWVYDRTVKIPDWRSYKLILTEQSMAKGNLNEVKKMVVDGGGVWEEMMGGIYFVHLPHEKAETAERAFDAFQIERERMVLEL